VTLTLFITFEGGEGCGKSTQARALWRRLIRLGIRAELTHEPGGTALGNQLRRILKGQRHESISPEAELMLFAACRTQLVTQVVRPSLEQGKVVICDRFADSTVAYQGYGRGLSLDTINKINNLAIQGVKPNLTLLLDIPAQEGLARKHHNTGDRFESENMSFHNRVRNGYLKLAAEEPGRWLVIDAKLPRVRTAKMVWSKVNELLRSRGILK